MLSIVSGFDICVMEHIFTAAGAACLYFHSKTGSEWVFIKAKTAFLKCMDTCKDTRKCAQFTNIFM